MARIILQLAVFSLKAQLRWSSLRICCGLKINIVILWLNKTVKIFGRRPRSPVFQCWIFELGNIDNAWNFRACLWMWDPKLVTKRSMEGNSFLILSLLLLCAPLGAWLHCSMEGNKGRKLYSLLFLKPQPTFIQNCTKSSFGIGQKWNS